MIKSILLPLQIKQVRYMKAFIYIILSLSILTISCKNDSRMMTLLESIDSLNHNGYYDSAYSELVKITPKDITGDGEKAYYDLLKTKVTLINDQMPESDSAINFCIKHYERNNDKRHLAEAYYYKGMLLADMGDNNGCILYLKKAETIGQDIDNPQLRFMTHLNLAYVNAEEKAYKTGIKYAQKALADIAGSGNIEKECMALNNIAMCHYYMGENDSAEAYMKQTEQRIGKIKDKENRAIFITNLGVLYFENGDYHKAEPLFRQAISLLNVSTTQINLAKVCYILNKDNEADKLIAQAWPESGAEEKAEILLFLAEKADREKDFKASARYYHEAKVLEDSIKKTKDTEGAVTTQRDYDKARYEQDVNRNATAAAIATIAVVAALGCWGAAYHRRKINKAKKTIADADRRIREYEERMAALELADRKHSDEAVKLERKIKRLKEEQNAIINRGQTLYNHIISEGTTATWKKKDFDEFIEYYRVGHPETVEEAEQGYKGLTSTNIFYLIITNGMKYDDAAAQRIMCMTQGAMRTMKSRIKAKKTEAA